jgi:hypothetical protein
MSYYFQGFPTVLYDVHVDGHPVEVTDIFRSVRLKPEVRDNLILYTSYTIQDGERPDHVSMKLYNSVDYYWVFFMVNENLVNLYTDWPLSTLELDNLINLKYKGYVLTSQNDFSTLFTQNETLVGLVSGARATLTEKDINTGVLKIQDIVGQFKDGELVQGVTSGSTLTIGGQRPFKDVIHHYENAIGHIVGRYDTGALPISNDEYERAENEKKSVIQVVKPQYIAKVAAEFFNQINPEQA